MSSTRVVGLEEIFIPNQHRSLLTPFNDYSPLSARGSCFLLSLVICAANAVVMYSSRHKGLGESMKRCVYFIKLKFPSNPCTLAQLRITQLVFDHALSPNLLNRNTSYCLPTINQLQSLQSHTILRNPPPITSSYLEFQCASSVPLIHLFLSLPYCPRRSYTGLCPTPSGAPQEL